MSDKGFNGNPLLKKPGTPVQWSPVLLEEIAKCRDNVAYFIENYVKIVNVDDGLVTFKMRRYQRKMLRSMVDNRDTVITTARQSGKTTTFCGYVLHYILFNEHKGVGILANKGDTARHILGRIQKSYEHLPKWLQQGTMEDNKGSLVLENGSTVFAAASGSSAIRGWSINVLIIDEAAHVEHWDEFFTSVYPTISSGKTTKTIFVSTPNGLNHFYKIWVDANRAKDDPQYNGYTPIKITWDQIPGRDAKWKKKQIAVLGEDKFAQENECEFMGSSGTLIDGWKLKEMVHLKPIQDPGPLKLCVYEKYQEKRRYVMTCDVSHGKGFDYSAFSVYDVTSFPYKQVAAFKNNAISPVDYAALIWRVNMNYKFCPLLVENNDIGHTVLHILLNDHNMENILTTETHGRTGKRIASGFSGKQSDLGIKTTKASKHIGCQMVKYMIEQNQLVINDWETIFEFARFSKHNNSYEAEEGFNDDLVMTCVLFAWLTTQEWFKAYAQGDLIAHLRGLNEKKMDEDLVPFGYINDGVTTYEDEGDFERFFFG